MIPNFQDLLNTKLGIHIDEVQTGKFADLMSSPDRPLSEEERAIIQVEVNRVYQTFMGKVAEGRQMSMQNVDSIGQGRVWTGKQALELGLIDGVGGLQRAVAAAARKANLTEYRIVNYPTIKDPFSSLLGSSKEKIKAWVLEDELAEYRQYIDQLRTVARVSGVQARLPYTVEIR